jgi:ubiquitin-conjugating enzyme E2 Z
MSRRLKRIIKEYDELNKSVDILKQSGIYFHINDENIDIIYAMLVGPKDTPYEGGFYFFKFEYPNDYPMSPPVATFCTRGLIKNGSVSIKVRFNPNLYTCGKVCLSMLNTWNGPGWVPTNTISNVLVAIQALVLNETPLINEPGFENSHFSILDKYNKIIEYANIKSAVFETILDTPTEFIFFQPIIYKIYKENVESYRDYILKRNADFNNFEIESPAYGMKTILDYSMMVYQVDEIFHKICQFEIEELAKSMDGTTI